MKPLATSLALYRSMLPKVSCLRLNTHLAGIGLTNIDCCSKAPRAWNTRLKQDLEGMGFTASRAETGLFTAQYKGSNIYILVYLDDIRVAAKNLADINHVKARRTAIFDVRDLGEAQYFLGMSLDRDRQARTLKMTQERLATELVHTHGLKEGRTKSVPMSTSSLCSSDQSTLIPYTTLQGKGCPARKFALHTVAPMRWRLIVSPSHYQSARSDFVFQALLLLKSFTLLQRYAIEFELNGEHL